MRPDQPGMSQAASAMSSVKTRLAATLSATSILRMDSSGSESGSDHLDKRLGVGSGARAQLLGEQPPAALEDAQRLGRVTHGKVDAQQPLVSGLPVRLETDRLLGSPQCKRGLAIPGVQFGPTVESPHQSRSQRVTLAVDPGAVRSGQEGPAQDGSRYHGRDISSLGCPGA